MKIRKVQANNRKKAFEVSAGRRTFLFPYARLDDPPQRDDMVREVYADSELGNEGFTYVLQSGVEGTVHIDEVLDYNRDPDYLNEALLYKLSVEAARRVEESALSRREIIRRLGTSASQFYRLLDQTNYRKSIAQMIALLAVLDCEVDVVIRPRAGAKTRA